VLHLHEVTPYSDGLLMLYTVGCGHPTKPWQFGKSYSYRLYLLGIGVGLKVCMKCVKLLVKHFSFDLSFEHWSVTIELYLEGISSPKSA
jgi:hypothetical protein